MNLGYQEVTCIRFNCLNRFDKFVKIFSMSDRDNTIKVKVHMKLTFRHENLGRLGSGRRSFPSCPESNANFIIVYDIV